MNAWQTQQHVPKHMVNEHKHHTRKHMSKQTRQPCTKNEQWYKHKADQTAILTVLPAPWVERACRWWKSSISERSRIS